VAVSSNGTVAQVDRVSGRPEVSYHRVELNARRFDAAWAGQGRIAVWGQDGLGTIDTRTWTTHAIDSDARNALATPHGIVAWTYDAPGISVYRPDGSLRFTALVDRVIHNRTFTQSAGLRQSRRRDSSRVRFVPAAS
jgi:hypothetical protein